MSKKTTSITAPALPAAATDNNFLTILAAILVSLNGQPNISLLLPPLQALLQNAAGRPAADAPATANATAAAAAKAGRNTSCHAPALPPETYYEYMTRSPQTRFKFPGSLALALRIAAVEDFPRSCRLDENCVALATMHLSAEELEGFYRTWHSYHDTRYHHAAAQAAACTAAK